LLQCSHTGALSELHLPCEPMRSRRAARILLAACLLCFLKSICPSTLLSSTVPLFGGPAPWRYNDWRQVTDNIRGGTSTAYLRGVTDIGAEFSGELDVTRPRDGFAGMAYKVENLPHDLTKLEGISIDVVEQDGNEYQISLEMRGAISGATHKFKFKPEKPGVHEMPFKDFVPMLRGNPAPKLPPLDLERVETISLEVGSHLGKQSGPYTLTLRGLSGVEGSFVPEETDKPKKWTCKGCSTMNSPTAETCVRCGAVRGAKKVEPKVEAAPSKWKCTGCGATNFAVADECMKCGGPRT